MNKTNRKNPFKEGSAGLSWFEGFCRRHPKLTLLSPQPLSYCRALCGTIDTLDDFYGKLGAIFGKMLLYNCDETGVTNVFKQGKVITELGRRYVYSVSAAERGKTHHIILCLCKWPRSATHDGLSEKETCAQTIQERCCSKYPFLRLVTVAGVMLIYFVNGLNSLFTHVSSFSSFGWAWFPYIY